MANTAATGHSVPHGKSLVEKIEEKLDLTIKAADPDAPDSRAWGRVEGVAAALGILRSSSTKDEISRSIARSLDG